MFSFKDRTPDVLKSLVVYLFTYVRDVIPAILVKPVAIFLQGLKTTQ